MRTKDFILLIGILTCVSCEEDTKSKGGAIVLNDSSTIVTESDTTYLQDMVADIKPPPMVRKALADTTTTTPVADTSAKDATSSAVAANDMSGDGLKVALKDFTIFISGIETISFGRHADNSAAFQLQSGTLPQKKMQTSGLAVDDVKQQYTSTIIMKTDIGELALSELDFRSDWEQLQGGNGIYTIAGIRSSKLDHATPTNSQLKNAVTRAMRRRKYGRSAQNKVMAMINSRSSVEKAPFQVKLKNVVWQFSCKDKEGKFIRKELRIDMPS